MNKNRLISAILIQAVKDWMRKPEERPDIREFLDSEIFEEMVVTLDLNPDSIRAKLVAGEFEDVSLRAAYR